MRRAQDEVNKQRAVERKAAVVLAAAAPRSKQEEAAAQLRRVELVELEKRQAALKKAQEELSASPD